MTKNLIEIIAHRGNSWAYPENTLAAFRSGWQVGAHGYELDLHLSADGQIYVHHDFSTLRCTGENYTIQHTNSDVLDRLDSGGWKGKDFTGEPIPKLLDILAATPPGQRIMLEIKHNQGILLPLARLLNQHPRLANKHRIDLLAKNSQTLAAAKHLLPLDTFLIVEEPSIPNILHQPDDPYAAIECAHSQGFTGIGLENSLMDKTWLKACWHANLQAMVWTVDDVNRAQQLASWGCSTVITNRPQTLVEAFRRES